MYPCPIFPPAVVFQNMSSYLICFVMEKVHTFLVYFLPDCTTQRGIHQAARVLWPRPTHHQSACYRHSDIRWTRSNIWANIPQQTDPTMHRCIYEHDHTHALATHTAWKEICPSLVPSPGLCLLLQMSMFPQSLPLPPFSLVEGMLPEISMHLKLNWRDFFFFSFPPNHTNTI